MAFRSLRDELLYDLGVQAEAERQLIEREKRARVELMICREAIDEARREMARLEAALLERCA